MPSAEQHRGRACLAREPGADAPLDARAACQAAGPVGDPDNWDWPRDATSFPDNAPLQALMLSATKLMGAYGQDSVRGCRP